MWWNKHFIKWINICIENPLKTWKKAKKYFKKPKTSIKFFSHPRYNCPLGSLKHLARILEIRAFDEGWKDKYDSPRHEISPYVWVCFFKRFGFSITWNVYYTDECGIEHDGDDYYWEYLLDYVYYTGKLSNVPLWTYTSKLFKKNKNFMVAIPIVNMSLNKKGIARLKMQLEANDK